MALVTMDTGTYDDSLIYTAGDLAGDWWWILAGAYNAQTVGGRALYNEIEYRPKSGCLVASRLSLVNGSLKLVTRYLDPDTKMRLVKVGKYDSIVLNVQEATPSN